MYQSLNDVGQRKRCIWHYQQRQVCALQQDAIAGTQCYSGCEFATNAGKKESREKAYAANAISVCTNATHRSGQAAIVLVETCPHRLAIVTRGLKTTETPGTVVTRAYLEAALAVERRRGQAEGRGHGADTAEGVVLPHGHRDGQPPLRQRLRAGTRRHARPVAADLLEWGLSSGLTSGFRVSV